MKVIIIDHEPYSNRKENHYFINEFKKTGIEVEYWDVQKALKYSKKANYVSSEVNRNLVISFSSQEEIIKSLNKLDAKDTFIFVEIWFNISTYNIFKALYQNDIIWARLDYYLNPTFSLNVKQKKIHRIKNINFQNIFSGVQSKIFNSFSGFKQYNIPNYYITTGASREFVPTCKTHLSLNYFDVIDYRITKKEERYIKEKYILFLDIMLLNHPDLQRMGINRDLIDKEIYYSKLNIFFNKLEEKYKMPVIIASHPKANYVDEFGSRKSIKYKTANLAINSELVVTHGSLSISYALLAKKPILYFFMEEEFKKNNFLRNFKERMYLAHFKLGSKVIDIDQSNYSVDYNLVDLELYTNFLKKYYMIPDQKFENFDLIKNIIYKKL